MQQLLSPVGLVSSPQRPGQSEQVDSRYETQQLLSPSTIVLVEAEHPQQAHRDVKAQPPRPNLKNIPPTNSSHQAKPEPNN